jgi:hypothetical protein
MRPVIRRSMLAQSRWSLGILDRGIGDRGNRFSDLLGAVLRSSVSLAL